MNSTKPNHLGHRARMREKLLINSNSLLDYEILEVLLFSAISRKDAKMIAKNLLAKFGSITDIINTDSHLLKEVEGATDSAIASIKLIKEIIVRESKDKIKKVNILDNWQDMIKYCQNNIGNLKYEKFHILFLNKKYRLISDKIYGESDNADSISINKNHIIKNSLNLSASYLILCHNHPSGNIKPSKADIDNTLKIKESLENIAIKILDHIIISDNSRYFSFKEQGLI